MNDLRRPAWREPMVWLVAAIPLMSVVSVGALIYASNKAGGVDGVSDAVQRTGQIQTANTGPVETAVALKLSAVVKRSLGGIDVLPASGEFDRSQSLVLTLRHPVNASEDRVLPLKTSVQGWTAAVEVTDAHDWVMELRPADGRWRLDGRWPARQQAALVRPSLTPVE